MSWRAWLSALSVTLAALSWSPALRFSPPNPKNGSPPNRKSLISSPAARTAFERRDYFTASG
jgi:hypothetical protein